MNTNFQAQTSAGKKRSSTILNWEAKVQFYDGLNGALFVNKTC